MKQMNMDESIIQVFMEKMDQNMGNDGVKISRVDKGNWFGSFAQC